MYHYIPISSDQLERSIQQNLFKVNYSLLIFAPPFQDPSIYNQLLNLLKKGVAIELLVSGSEQNKFASNLEYFNFLLRLKKTGGDVFKFKKDLPFTVLPDDHFCIIDNKILLASEQVNGETPENLGQLIQTYTNHYVKLKGFTSSFAITDHDIDIELSASKLVLEQSEKVTIHWRVTNARHVEINKGVGRVDNEGSIDLTLKEDAHIRIKAQGIGQTKIKTLYIKVYQEIGFAYKILAYDQQLKEYVELESPVTHPDNFGINEGQRIKLTWSITNAEWIKLDGVGNIGYQGEKIFTPTTTSTFKLSAKGAMGTATRNIKIHVLPKVDSGNLAIPLHNSITDLHDPMKELHELGSISMGSVDELYKSQIQSNSSPIVQKTKKPLWKRLMFWK